MNKVDGLLNVYKPKGMTSHDVVNRIRRIFNTKQVGHTGTLDPNAEGVLVVCLNQATKLVQFLEADIKRYRCELILGISTDTYDITGKVVEENKELELSEEVVIKTIKTFIGKQKQYPPIYSAIKVNGKKLYEYAHKNQSVNIEARDIEIFEIDNISCLTKKEYYTISFDVLVSKGTYIRSLCFDIGKALGIPATMGELLRLQSGAFLLENADKLEDIEKGQYHLIEMVDAISNMKKIDVKDNSELRFKAENGMKISLKYFDEIFDKITFINLDKIVAIYKYYEEDDKRCYKAVRVWR